MRGRLHRARMLAPESQATTRVAALVGRHLLPSMPVRHHPIALRRRELLELLVSLHHPLALIRRKSAVARVVLLEFFALRLGKLAPPAQSFEDSPALFRRQIAEPLEVLLDLLPLLGTHRLPSPIVLE